MASVAVACGRWLQRSRGHDLAHRLCMRGRSKISSALVLEPAVLLGSLGLLGSVVRRDESGA